MSRYRDRRSARRKALRGQSFADWLKEDKLVRRTELAEAVGRLIEYREWRMKQIKRQNRWYRRLWRWVKATFSTGVPHGAETEQTERGEGEDGTERSDLRLEPPG